MLLQTGSTHKPQAKLTNQPVLQTRQEQPQHTAVLTNHKTLALQMLQGQHQQHNTGWLATSKFYGGCREAFHGTALLTGTVSSTKPWVVRSCTAGAVVGAILHAGGSAYATSHATSHRPAYTVGRNYVSPALNGLGSLSTVQGKRRCKQVPTHRPWGLGGKPRKHTNHNNKAPGKGSLKRCPSPAHALCAAIRLCGSVCGGCLACVILLLAQTRQPTKQRRDNLNDIHTALRLNIPQSTQKHNKTQGNLRCHVVV